MSDEDSSADCDLLAGFGAWEGTDQREVVEEIHERSKRKSDDGVEAYR